MQHVVKLYVEEGDRLKVNHGVHVDFVATVSPCGRRDIAYLQILSLNGSDRLRLSTCRIHQSKTQSLEERKRRKDFWYLVAGLVRTAIGSL